MPLDFYFQLTANLVPGPNDLLKCNPLELFLHRYDELPETHLNLKNKFALLLLVTLHNYFEQVNFNLECVFTSKVS